MKAGQSHITSVVILKAASDVFARMADVRNLNRWSFGTWKTEILPDDLVLGTSLFDNSQVYVRIDKDEARLSIDFLLGAHAALGDDQSVLTFIAWRSETMDDDRWRRLTASHEMEAVLVKSLIESGQM